MRTYAIVWFDRLDLPSDTRGPMLLDDAMKLAKRFAADGCNASVFKLTEVAFFKGENDANAILTS